MKSLLLISILLLSSCTQYRYDITYNKCDGSTGKYTYINDGEYPFYSSREKRLWQGGSIGNVCDFFYTRTEIK